MSEERELLKRWLSGEHNKIPTHISLLLETQNLLAQPEPEPYCWEVSNLFGNKQYLYSKPRDEVYSVYSVIPLYRSPPNQEYLSMEEPKSEPDIDYVVREIHKKCFHQSLNTAPVITVRDALSIFRKFFKSKRTPIKPKFDQEEFDEMVRKGTKAWSGVDVNKLFGEWDGMK